MSYIVSWSGEIGRVMIEDIMFDIFEKPSLPFSFDSLYYEVPTSLFIKTLDGITVNLSEEEKAACVKYCLDFKESDDFPVIALDPSYNVYMGTMSKGEAISKGYTYLYNIEVPSFTPAIYEDNTWVKVTYGITTTGRLVVDPGSANSSYVMLFTNKTWENFPHPSTIEMIYDFKKEEWVDNRDFNSTLEQAKTLVRYDALIAMGEYDVLKNDTDPVLYLFQYDELNRFKSNSNASTPFVDAICKELGTDKDSFMNRINEKYNVERLTALGSIHGRMIKYLDILSECKTLSDIDSVMASIPLVYSSPWNKTME